MGCMRWTVVVPGALVPAPIAADVIGAAQAPQLSRLICRARIGAPQPATAPTLGAAHWGWLWRRFSGREDTPVTAPYAWRALNDADLQANAGTLWQADPVHFALALDHMLVLPLEDTDALDREETLSLAAEAETCARSAGARVCVLDRHWFLRFDAPWSLHTTPLQAAIGDSIEPLLPAGSDSPRWRRLLTDIQIAWHHHAVNAAREARGARAVNGLWLHGGGPVGTLPGCGLAQVASDEPAVRGWALAAGVPAAAVGPGEVEIGAHGDALVLWPHLFASFKAAAWHAWLAQFAAFDQWLAGFVSRAFTAAAEVELVLCGRVQTRAVILARSDGWQLWRSAAPVATLSEPVSEAR
jgi:hypothetical protein